MNRPVLTKKRAIITLAICATLAVSTIILLQMNKTTEAALVQPYLEPVCFWGFEEGSGFVVGDSSGYGNDGTIYGATWENGKIGNGLSFDGDNDYVTANSNNPQLDNSDFTIMGWFKPEPLAKYQFIWNKQRPNCYITPSLDRFGFELYDGVNKPVFVLSSIVNKWYFLVQVHQGTLHKAYVFDEQGLIGTAERDDIGTNTGSNSYAFNVGKKGWWSSEISSNFQGIADEIRIYDQALTEDEIQEIYSNPNFSSKLLVKMPEGTNKLIVTFSWQGVDEPSLTVETTAGTFTEESFQIYEKASYNSGSDTWLNIKRLTFPFDALSSDEEWYLTIDLGEIEDYQIAVEIQR